MGSHSNLVSGVSPTKYTVTVIIKPILPFMRNGGVSHFSEKVGSEWNQGYSVWKLDL